LRKIITALILPFNFCLGLLLIGLLFLLFTARQRFGKTLISFSVLLLLLFSFPPFANRLIFSLESKYAPLSSEELERQDTRYVVILGGGHNSSRPPASQLSPSSLARLIEGIRIYREKPGTKLILSGGPVFDPEPNARAMFNTARILGVPESDLEMESESKDTEEEAKFLASRLKQEPFYLVTSAVHMPRSMALFRKQKMNPVPAPTDYAFRLIDPPWLLRYVPNLGAYQQSERAVREYLGLAYSRMRRKAD
jgi:uncharacterized SAM-binding protein YcdF (DUF218 family)